MKALKFLARPDEPAKDHMLPEGRYWNWLLGRAGFSKPPSGKRRPWAGDMADEARTAIQGRRERMSQETWESGVIFVRRVPEVGEREDAGGSAAILIEDEGDHS